MASILYVEAIQAYQSWYVNRIVPRAGASQLQGTGALGPLAHSIIHVPVRKEVSGYIVDLYGAHDFYGVSLTPAAVTPNLWEMSDMLED